MANRNKNTYKKKNGNNHQKPSSTENKSTKPEVDNKDKQFMKTMDPEKFREISKSSDGNDPDYYFTNKELADQAATFPFPYFLGTRPTIGNYNVPTCMVIQFNPSVGVTGTGKPNSGANMAAQKLYTRLSVASGRTANYQPNDVIMGVQAVISLAEMIEYGRRFFGVATTYSARNRVYAWRLISMLAGTQTETFGVDFVTNMADYRMKLNMIIAKINQIPLLADLGITRKSIEMYQKVYLDESSDMAQTYAFIPYSTWVLDETGSSGSVLRTELLSNHNTTFADILSLITAQADALLSSTTLNMVYADIFNYQAKYSANFLTLDFIPEGYAVIPEYNTRALQQIHNTVLTSEPAAVTSTSFTYSNNVVSDVQNGLVIYNPGFTISNPASGIPRALVFDFETSAPDLIDKVDNIKFASLFGGGRTIAISSTTYAYDTVLPDHYAVRAIVYGARPQDYLIVNLNWSVYNGLSTTPLSILTSGGDFSSYSSYAQLAYADLLGKFDHVFLGVDYSSTDNRNPYYIMGDLNYFTTMEREHFERITDLEYQGLYELR